MFQIIQRETAKYPLEISHVLSELEHNRSIQHLIRRKDILFVLKCIRELEANHDNSTYSINKFCAALATSRAHLHRRLTEIFGVSATKLIKRYRLYHSLLLLGSNQLSIAQVAYKCGFSNPSYFAKCFRLEYGYSPKVFQSDKVLKEQ